MKSGHRTAQGKTIDMQSLISRNEKVRAVGINQKVNARGDTIDDKGKVIVPVTEKVGKRYQGSVSNRSAIPKKAAPEKLTKEEMELEYLNELDDEIQKIKKQERK